MIAAQGKLVEMLCTHRTRHAGLQVQQTTYLVVIELQPLIATDAGEGVVMATMASPAVHQDTVQLVPAT